MYKVHSMVLREHGEQFRSYVVFDSEEDELLCAGQSSVHNEHTAQANRKKAMREGLAHATLTVDDGSTVQVYDHHIPDASCILTQLSKEVNTLLSKKNLTVKLSSSDDPIDDIAMGLSRMSRVAENTLTTAVSKPEYSVSNPVCLYADGSYKNNDDGATAIGYALIDDDGTLIGLGSHSIPSAISSLEAEYEAIRAGINKANKYDHITELTLISDNQRVADTLAGRKDPLDRNTTLITDITDTVEEFNEVTVSKESRSKNLLADALATYGHKGSLVGAI